MADGAVLVVEDSADLRALLASQLARAGYLIAETATVAEAVDAAHRAPPDVVLLDLVLPDGDGLSLLDALKADRATASAPVLVITADTRGDVLASALDRGAHDLISKPFDLDEVVARVGAAIRVKREHDRLASARQTLRAQRDFIEAVIDTLDAIVLVVDVDGGVVHVNRTGEQLSGYRVHDLVGRRAREVFGSTEPSATAVNPFEQPGLGSPTPIELAWRSSDGHLRTISWATRAVMNEDGSFRFGVAAGVDVTALRTADRRLRACVDVIQEGIAVLDARRNEAGQIVEFEIVFANPAATALNAGMVEGGVVPAELFNACVAVVEGGHAAQRHLESDADGERVTFEFNIARLDDGVVVAFSDITERQLAEERLAWAATHDALTGLANRPLLVDRIGHALTRRADSPKSDLAVLFVDLDGFKAVNDARGHHAGDLVLAEVARRLRDIVRPADTVARFGGDEFVVLAEELTTPADATALATRIGAAVASVEGLHASVGVAIARPGDSAETLLRRADEAMYEEKRRGR